jgi:hypothetical protein
MTAFGSLGEGYAKVVRSVTPSSLKAFSSGFPTPIASRRRLEGTLSVNRVSLDATPTNNRRSDYLINRWLSMGDFIAAIQSRGVHS